MRDGGKAVLGLGLVGLTGAIIYAVTRKAEAAPPVTPPPGEGIVAVDEVIDAEYRSGNVLWAALANWRKVHTSWINEWPLDTDIQFVWEIKNIGKVGAYFQVYIFDPGNWMYLDPGGKVQIYEDFHTPAVPVIPGYQYARITILGRNVTGERIGAVWTSDEFEIIYV